MKWLLITFFYTCRPLFLIQPSLEKLPLTLDEKYNKWNWTMCCEWETFKKFSPLWDVFSKPFLRIYGLTRKRYLKNGKCQGEQKVMVPSRHSRTDLHALKTLKRMWHHAQVLYRFKADRVPGLSAGLENPFHIVTENIYFKKYNVVK